jgi:hypothetical protein
MSRREDRERKAAEWLEHLRNWKDSGTSLSAYARGHGLALWAVYHWRRVLQHEGRWSGEPRHRRKSSPLARGSERIALRFARVSVSDPVRRASLTVRVQLRNGRHAEVELSERGELAEVLAIVEQLA